MTFNGKDTGQKKIKQWNGVINQFSLYFSIRLSIRAYFIYFSIFFQSLSVNSDNNNLQLAVGHTSLFTTRFWLLMWLVLQTSWPIFSAFPCMNKETNLRRTLVLELTYLSNLCNPTKKMCCFGVDPALSLQMGECNLVLFDIWRRMLLRKVCASFCVGTCIISSGLCFSS